MIKNILIAILIIIAANTYSQSVEIISKERAKEIVDSLKKIEGQSFKHIVETAYFYENSQKNRNYFFKCLNTISHGFLIPSPKVTETGETIDDGTEYIILWYGKSVDSGEPQWREKPETSLNEKIWIYFNVPSVDQENIEDVYIGYICSPTMCTKRDSEGK